MSIEDLTREAEDRAEAAMRRVADTARRAIQDKLDEPYPPASEPGESPRRRSGRLREGIDVQVIRHGDLIELVASSSAPYTSNLEDEARPVISGLPDDFAEQIITEIEADDPSFP